MSLWHLSGSVAFNSRKWVSDLGVWGFSTAGQENQRSKKFQSRQVFPTLASVFRLFSERFSHFCQLFCFLYSCTLFLHLHTQMRHSSPFLIFSWKWHFHYSQRISICSKCVICLQRREHPVSKVLFCFILIKKAESLYKHKFFRWREIQTLQLKTREGRFHNGIKKRKGSKTTPPEASEWKRLNLTFRLKLNLQIFANS